MRQQKLLSAPRLLLVDGLALVREGLKSLFSAQKESWTIMEAQSGHQALDILRREPVDVAIIDLTAPAINGLELTRRIQAEFDQVAVLVLTLHCQEQYIVRALKAGARGYLTMDATPGELMAAIRKVALGGVYLSSHAADRVVLELNGQAQAPEVQSLSYRELDILQRIVDGQRPMEIAHALSLSIKTVSTHKRHIQDKLRLPSTAALVRFGLEHRLGLDLMAVPPECPRGGVCGARAGYGVLKAAGSA